MGQHEEVMTVRILGVDYEVVESESLGQQGLAGLCSFADNTILINAGIPYENQRSTVLHEILESINDMLELDLKHRTITQLETALNQVLSDNPTLLKLWTYELEEAEAAQKKKKKKKKRSK